MSLHLQIQKGKHIHKPLMKGYGVQGTKYNEMLCSFPQLLEQ